MGGVASRISHSSPIVTTASILLSATEKATTDTLNCTHTAREHENALTKGPKEWGVSVAGSGVVFMVT